MHPTEFVQSLDRIQRAFSKTTRTRRKQVLNFNFSVNLPTAHVVQAGGGLTRTALGMDYWKSVSTPFTRRIYWAIYDPWLGIPSPESPTLTKRSHRKWSRWSVALGVQVLSCDNGCLAGQIDLARSPRPAGQRHKLYCWSNRLRKSKFEIQVFCQYGAHRSDRLILTIKPCFERLSCDA